MKQRYTLLILSAMLLVSACSPHPAAGVWDSADENSYGIAQIIVSFDGKAQFDSTKGDAATWHCFWGAMGKQQVSLECTASTRPEKAENFLLTIHQQGLAELQHNSEPVGVFERQDDNPVLE